MYRIFIVFFFLCTSANSETSLYPSSTSGSISQEKIDNNSFFWGTEDSNGVIDFKIELEKTGIYKLEAKVIAVDGTSNSFWVNVPSLTSDYEWHIPQTSEPSWKSAGNYFLESGENRIRFSVRESNTKIADISLSFQSLEEVTEEENLPVGIPESSMDRNDCFFEGELENFSNNLERHNVSGCAAPSIIPQLTVRSQRPYVSKSSEYSCAGLRENYFYSEALNIFTEDLVELVNDTDVNPQATNVHCSVNTYYSWARVNAMSEISTKGERGQSELDRMWALIDIASSYFSNYHVQERAQGQSVGQSNKHQLIVDWLEGLGDQVRLESSYLNGSDLYNVNTNFWRAYALTVTGLLSQNPYHLQEAESVFIAAMKQVGSNEPDTEYDEGFLPYELDRKERATHYQAYALMPIAGMASITESYSCDFASTDWRRNQLRRLTRKTIEGYIDTDVFADAVEEKLGTRYAQIRGTNPKQALLLIQNLNDETIYENVLNFVSTYTGQGVEATASFYNNFGGDLARFVNRINMLKSEINGALCP